MGWETRKGKGQYYTRSRREGGRVRREYIPVGSAALVAEFDAAKREARTLERALAAQAWAEERAQAEMADGLLEVLEAACAEMTREGLVAAGYHQHKREWRRRRGEQQGNEAGGNREGSEARGQRAESSAGDGVAGQEATDGGGASAST